LSFKLHDETNAIYDAVSSKDANSDNVQFFKHTPKLIVFGRHNLQTFKRNNTLINELLLMQFYLINVSPKLHH